MASLPPRGSSWTIYRPSGVCHSWLQSPPFLSGRLCQREYGAEAPPPRPRLRWFAAPLPLASQRSWRCVAAGVSLIILPCQSTEADPGVADPVGAVAAVAVPAKRAQNFGRVGYRLAG